jgi:hypothetical protein
MNEPGPLNSADFERMSIRIVNLEGMLSKIFD